MASRKRPAACVDRDKRCAVYDVTMAYEKCDNIKDLRPILDKIFKKWACQVEEGSETGYKHWQIRGSLFVKKRLHEAIRTHHELEGHWSVTSGACTTFNYVMKNDTRVEGPYSDKDPPEKVPTRQLVEFMTKEMYGWQKWLIDSAQEVEDRKIKVVLDHNGNTGKSIMCEYLEFHDLGVELPPMSSAEDLLQAVFGIGEHKCYLIDMPRGMKKDRLASFYAGLESLKNGTVYDKRYAFKKLRMSRPQVFVFSNTMPDLSLLSIDRWSIFQVTNDQNILQVDMQDDVPLNRLCARDSTVCAARLQHRTALFEEPADALQRQWHNHDNRRLAFEARSMLSQPGYKLGSHYMHRMRSNQGHEVAGVRNRARLAIRLATCT